MLWRGAGQYNAYSVLLLLLLLLREPISTPLREMLPPWKMRGPVRYEVPGGGWERLGSKWKCQPKVEKKSNVRRSGVGCHWHLDGDCEASWRRTETGEEKRTRCSPGSRSFLGAYQLQISQQSNCWHQEKRQGWEVVLQGSCPGFCPPGPWQCGPEQHAWPGKEHSSLQGSH